MYAIIEDSGTQIKVSEGDVVNVAIRELPADVATLTFDKVLAVSKAEGELSVGHPHVSGAKVTADILSRERGPKVRIFKFARRKNYRRKKGHRQDLMRVKITSIQG
ncbi:MAG: 50S ribosomal protein L21 [Phycisphaera sp.]|nr:50S ribosomal protein L21 [Phycisphaera sp.]